MCIKKGDKKISDSENKNAAELGFIGDHETPAILSNVQRQRTVLGTGKIPKELTELGAHMTTYFEGDEGHKPEVKVTQLTTGDRKIWKIDVPVDETFRGALPGQNLIRRPRELFLKELGEQVSFRECVQFGTMPVLFRDMFWAGKSHYSEGSMGDECSHCGSMITRVGTSKIPLIHGDVWEKSITVKDSMELVRS